jgi:hypothetical protein
MHLFIGIGVTEMPIYLRCPAVSSSLGCQNYGDWRGVTDSSS